MTSRLPPTPEATPTKEKLPVSSARSAHEALGGYGQTSNYRSEPDSENYTALVPEIRALQDEILRETRALRDEILRETRALQEEMHRLREDLEAIIGSESQYHDGLEFYPGDGGSGHNNETSNSATAAASEPDEQPPIDTNHEHENTPSFSYLPDNTVLTDMQKMFDDLVHYGRPDRRIRGVDAAFNPPVSDDLSATTLVVVRDNSISERRVWVPSEDVVSRRDEWKDVHDTIKTLWPTIPGGGPRMDRRHDVPSDELDFGLGLLHYGMQQRQGNDERENDTTTVSASQFSVAEFEMRGYNQDGVLKRINHVPVAVEGEEVILGMRWYLIHSFPKMCEHPHANNWRQNDTTGIYPSEALLCALTCSL